MVWTGDRSRGVAAVFLFFAVKSIDANLQDPLGFSPCGTCQHGAVGISATHTRVCSYPSAGSMIAIEPAVNRQPVLINVSLAGDHRMWSAVTQHASQSESFIRSIAFDGKYIFLWHHVSFGSHCIEQILKCCLQHSRLVMHAVMKAQFRAFQAKLSQHPGFSVLL